MACFFASLVPKVTTEINGNASIFANIRFLKCAIRGPELSHCESLLGKKTKNKTKKQTTKTNKQTNKKTKKTKKPHSLSFASGFSSFFSLSCPSHIALPFLTLTLILIRHPSKRIYEDTVGEN